MQKKVKKAMLITAENTASMPENNGRKIKIGSSSEDAIENMSLTPLNMGSSRE